MILCSMTVVCCMYKMLCLDVMRFCVIDQKWVQSLAGLVNISKIGL